MTYYTNNSVIFCEIYIVFCVKLCYNTKIEKGYFL